MLAHLLLATTDEAVLYIANADDPTAARDDAVTALDRLINGRQAGGCGLQPSTEPTPS